MTLTELRYVVALARERHFGRAAASSFVSQPTLSVAVKKLEDELGTPLFERGGAEVTPTPLGEQVVEYAQAILEQVEGIRNLARGHADPLQGVLRLGAIYTVGPYLLPQLIPNLHDTAPLMPLLIEEGFTADLRRRLKQGELDAIIVALPFDEPGVTVRPLYEEPFVALLPSAHPLSAQSQLPLEALAGEDLLLLGPGHCLRDQILTACPACARPSGSAQGESHLAGSSLETLRHMVASGLGVTILPCTAAGAERYADRLIAVRRLSDPVPHRRVALAWRSSFPRPGAIEVLTRAILDTPMSCVELC
ncbi:LysR family transcriptional regulator [Acidihalobacter yilgarnensis]|uniref:LysR family transcriptional regulator n=1 Tax=Acidihalobacter yilgarnensis TaxID=2819280 RepID=A0A1D8IPT9_9GAMM|nr:hydrogen peroxide-inducible genes activator [Acidihalobacter yilgarnensis]AOU98435.1 LysR family transcriptional regulator [Acidihalobacter yilgarnensis]